MFVEFDEKLCPQRTRSVFQIDLPRPPVTDDSCRITGRHKQPAEKLQNTRQCADHKLIQQDSKNNDRAQPSERPFG